MQLQPVDVVAQIDTTNFKNNYYNPCRPLVISDLAKQWLAWQKWNWDYFKQVVGRQKVGIYNNIKSDALTPVNTADGYTTFGEYIDMILNGPTALRVFFV